MFVPRHQLIVERILGSEYAHTLTRFIGLLEILMAVWILSGIKSRLNALIQIIIIGSMNVLEFFLAEDLLLWGKFNIILAFILISIIYLYEFKLKKSSVCC